jgi:hypothetical protein
MGTFSNDLQFSAVVASFGMLPRVESSEYRKEFVDLAGFAHKVAGQHIPLLAKEGCGRDLKNIAKPPWWERTGWLVQLPINPWLEPTTPSARANVASRSLPDRAATPPFFKEGTTAYGGRAAPAFSEFAPAVGNHVPEREAGRRESGCFSSMTHDRKDPNTTVAAIVTTQTGFACSGGL